MPRVALLALAVGLVLADSSVVTLGLPDVVEEFGSSPQDVSWVLTGYNLALALAALPAAALVRRASPAAVAGGGLAVFAAASLLCALAPSLGVLVAARCVQGLGGAAVACAALVLLVEAAGSRPRGTTIWGAAGAIGAAVGPAAGGFLTEALSWEAIFAVQVPMALAALPALRGQVLRSDTPPSLAHGGESSIAPGGSAGAAGVRMQDLTPGVDWRHLAALAFLGAGLTAALFLLVLLLIAGWRVSPLAAALTVSVMPAAALLAARVRGGDTRVRGGAGAILVAGGLAALGLLPSSSIAVTLLPQAFVGFGLGLSLGALTEAALHGRTPLVTHGAWTLAARHAGVVAALALLTPVFTADLLEQEERASASVLARILDAPLEPTTKLAVGVRLARELQGPIGRVPEVGPAFAEADPAPGEEASLARLGDEVADELDRAATTAFERSFLLAALLSLGALVPLLWPRGGGRA